MNYKRIIDSINSKESQNLWTVSCGASERTEFDSNESPAVHPPDAAGTRRGEEGPEIGPVDRFHRRTGRKALERVFRQENRSLRLFRPGDGSGRAQWAMKAGEVPVSMVFSASETLKTP